MSCSCTTNAPSPMYLSRAHLRYRVTFSRRDRTMRAKTVAAAAALAALPPISALPAMRQGGFLRGGVPRSESKSVACRWKAHHNLHVCRTAAPTGACKRATAQRAALSESLSAALPLKSASFGPFLAETRKGRTLVFGCQTPICFPCLGENFLI